MSKNIINITKNAFKKMNNIMINSNNNSGFYFGVTSGGCNGFNFDLRLMNEKELPEILKLKPSIISDEKVNVYIEPMSEIYLIGTTIDYVSEDYTKAVFESKFIYNVDKTLASSCGCGHSFTPKNR
tara:strand:+ start:536 stop:913 length:378 start_codon:yes stop_codon:yes gene_type:complete